MSIYVQEFLKICSRDRRDEIHISNILNENVLLDWEFKPGTPASLVRCSTTDLSKPINIYGPSRPNYHIPSLTKFLPSKTHTSPCQDLIDFTNDWSKMVTAQNVTEMRENIEINNFLHRRRKMCAHEKSEIILKK